MFEEQQEEDKQSTKRGKIVVVSIVVVLLIVGTLAYLDSRGNLRSPSSTSASTAAPAVVKGDPAKDLRVISTKVDKDPSGTIAQWLVDVRNESHTLTYSHIKYQTTYYGPNQAVIGQNSGEMPVTLGPGEEQNVQFNDAQYPDNLTLAHVVIVDAQASQ